MTTYVIEQFVNHANQYEPIENGEFDSLEAAESAVNELELIGFTDLRVTAR